MWQQCREYREYRVEFLQTDEVTVDLASEIAPMSEVNQSLGLGLGLGGSAFINSNFIPCPYLTFAAGDRAACPYRSDFTCSLNDI